MNLCFIIDSQWLCQSYNSNWHVNSRVMSNTFVSGVVDGGNDPWWGQTKDYEIGIFCFSAKCGALRSKSKDWLDWSQNNLSKRNVYLWAIASMSLYHKNLSQRVCLVQNRYHVTCSQHNIAEKFISWCKTATIYLLISQSILGPLWPWSYGSWIYNYLCIQCLSQLMLWFPISIRARCTTLYDKVCQWLATGRWFSPVSSTNKTDSHDMTEILLKVALNTIKQTNNPKPSYLLMCKHE
jgi:hypothetical protein